MTIGLLIWFLLLRLTLLALCIGDVGTGAPAAIGVGFLQDMQVVFILAAIGILIRFSTHRLTRKLSAAVWVWPKRIFTTLAWFTIIFFSLAEIFFWLEFESRFNFIAVDYLIYTNEVLLNIWQSYPVIWIIIGTLIVASAITVYVQPRLSRLHRKIWSWSGTRIIYLALLILSIIPILNPEAMSKSPATAEIASNGWKNLVTAFFSNDISYTRFYKTLPNDVIEKNIYSPEMASHLGQWINSTYNRDKKYNVMLVVMESMSRKFLTPFGNDKGWTPNLDRLYKDGLAFSQIYATGTRTVRGLEAVDLSIPPTPGQSVLRRPGFEDLYSLGSYLESAGYVNEFLYGGYAIFDNMGGFFAANHMKVVDHTDVDKSQITFENAWGICDEDMFHVAVAEADKITAQNKPFFQLIMTTSNHQPYTYPQHIDIKSGTGRPGAVKYSDYAIGELFKEAEKKPWFKDTIFVFVADHNANVAGHMALPLRDFPIPFVIYGPDIVKAQVVDRIGSQMDVGPTILDVLGFSYKNHFFGKSLLQPGVARAFLATYQSLGYLRDNILTVLEPKKRVIQYDITGDQQVERAQVNSKLVDEAVSYYQYASQLFQNQKMKNSSDSKITFQRKD
jgi:phosphoglycerol transferase MdoB-like AlkP superfamily enzyme